MVAIPGSQNGEGVPQQQNALRWQERQLSSAPNNERIVFAPESGENTINDLIRGNAVSSAAQAAECDLIRVWVYLGIQ